jgi:hypothetical protein
MTWKEKLERGGYAETDNSAAPRIQVLSWPFGQRSA